MNHAKFLFLSCLALCASVACSDDFEPASLVVKTRVLAVQADTPFALPGQEVHLTALAYDPSDRALSWGWGTCEAVESTAAVDCLRKARFEELELGSARTTHTLTVPSSAASYVGVVVIVCPGSIEPGETQRMPFVCRDTAGRVLSLDEFELGMKRIYLRPSELNHNPRIEGITLDGVEWTPELVPSARCTHRDCRDYAEQHIVVRTAGASEQTVDANGLPIEEQSIVQFFATGGEFDDDYKLVGKSDNVWRARKKDAGKLLRFWFVVRDDRGGVAWVERSLQVR